MVSTRADLVFQQGNHHPFDAFGYASQSQLLHGSTDIIIPLIIWQEIVKKIYHPGMRGISRSHKFSPYNARLVAAFLDLVADFFGGRGRLAPLLSPRTGAGYVVRQRQLIKEGITFTLEG